MLYYGIRYSEMIMDDDYVTLKSGSCVTYIPRSEYDEHLRVTEKRKQEELEKGLKETMRKLERDRIKHEIFIKHLFEEN